MSSPLSITTEEQLQHAGESRPPVFWRAEGSLLNLSAIRPVAFFTWNAQSFAERWARRGGVGLLALVRPILYSMNRVFATRVLHTLLRGVSQDRLDLLGEEYFHYVLRPWLKRKSVEKLSEVMASGAPVVLVSQGLDHVMRPLAEYLGVKHLVANRLEFRDGLATGRLLAPVIRPRGGLALLTPARRDGRLSIEDLCTSLGITPDVLRNAVVEAKRRVPAVSKKIVLFEPHSKPRELSVKKSLRGKDILLIGATGFIGKVWLAKVLSDASEIGKVYLLIRRTRSTTAVRRFEKIVEESPVFDALHERYADRFGDFIKEHVEVIEGDVSSPRLGIDPETHSRLLKTVDVVINSSGLTDFNPDLRDTLSINVDGTVNVLEFVRQSHHAAMLHLSTCYVAGAREGRVGEELTPNYTPSGVEGFNAETEREVLHNLVKDIQRQAESPEITEALRSRVLERRSGGDDLDATALENVIRKGRIRWVKTKLIEAGIQRAKELGWPNTYTFTKSLAESLIAQLGAGLPVAIVRPAIVETSTRDPFKGWNEGVNTSAPISYLLGTFFRQLPSNERKCLDIVPVDLVCRGMCLITAALIERRHEAVYQLATSARNPCNMRRSVELTALAHRKHYRSQNGLQHRLRAKFESIPVSKARYQNLSAPRQKAIVRAIQRISSPLPLMKSPLMRKERGLDRVEKLIELYEPFILHNQHVFEAQNVELLSEALPSDEVDAFGYDPLSIDWWDYWINIHIPALRKWSYPLIEGRPVEYESRRELRLQGEGGKNFRSVTYPVEPHA